MSKSLFAELSQHKIRINSVDLGLFHAPMTDRKLGTDHQRQEFTGQIPMGFVATQKDLDDAFVASRIKCTFVLYNRIMHYR